MTRRLRWSLAGLLAVAGVVIAVPADSTAQRSPDPPHVDRPGPPRPAPRPVLLRVPSESMAPAVPVGATVRIDYDAFDATQPRLDDIVIFRPPRSAEISLRCGVLKYRRQMCSRPVRRLASAKFVKRVVGLPGDRLLMRGGRLTRNGEPLTEPYADVSSCRRIECDFPREITIASGHFFMLGDNRGASDDSRFWGPVPSRALLARVVGCTTEAGLPCGDAP